MAKPFAGVPLSSKSSMEVPIEIVSQPSHVDIDALYNRQTEGSAVPDEAVERLIPVAGAENFGNNAPVESVKAEAVRTGQIKVSELDLTDFDDFMHSSIVAIPKRLPTMLDVRAKDPNFRLRWVNFKADGGRMVDERKAMGFTVAQREDVMGLESDSIMVQTDGIKYHDVLLMKVPTKLLFGWLKQNALESMQTVTPKNLHRRAVQKAQESFRKGLSGENTGGKAVSDLAESVTFFSPGS